MASPEETSRNQLREFRVVVSDVVGELRSQEVRNTYASLTLMELADQHLKFLSSTEGRPGRLERITALRDAYLSKIEGMKSTPPENFRTPDPVNDVNTAP